MEKARGGREEQERRSALAVLGDDSSADSAVLISMDDAWPPPIKPPFAADATPFPELEPPPRDFSEVQHARDRMALVQQAVDCARERARMFRLLALGCVTHEYRENIQRERSDTPSVECPRTQ